MLPFMTLYCGIRYGTFQPHYKKVLYQYEEFGKPGDALYRFYWRHRDGLKEIVGPRWKELKEFFSAKFGGSWKKIKDSFISMFGGPWKKLKASFVLTFGGYWKKLMGFIRKPSPSVPAPDDISLDSIRTD